MSVRVVIAYECPTPDCGAGLHLDLEFEDERSVVKVRGIRCNECDVEMVEVIPEP